MQQSFFHLNWCCLKNPNMKVINNSGLTSFGGVNFVFDRLLQLDIDKLLIENLPSLPSQTKYSWKDIIFSYWSIFFAGGDCAEDVSKNLRSVFFNNPLVQAPSPDRLLNRLKDLVEPKMHIKKNRCRTEHEFSLNDVLSNLNLAILKKLLTSNNSPTILDYDNTVIYTNKSDTRRTYKKENGYVPGVGIINNNIAYIENRNGNSTPHVLQEETLERMFDKLKSKDIDIDIFRADSASYQFLTIATAAKYTSKIFIKARMSSTLCNEIQKAKDWKKVNIDGKDAYRVSIIYTPFKRTAKDSKKESLLKEYRFVITKESNFDNQLNLFTNEACKYSIIITNDFDLSDNEVVMFYNNRGKQEREFDTLKNDFGWNKLPFSKLEQNTVYLYITAMCKNIYNYLICYFSKRVKGLKSTYRLKKFIFRFICVPAKWIKTARQYKLKIYGFG